VLIAVVLVAVDLAIRIAAGVREVHLVPADQKATRPEWFDGVVTLNQALGAVPTVGGSRAYDVDDSAVIRFDNMDIRSFDLDLEVSWLVQGTSSVEQMCAVEALYREASRQLIPAEWEKEPLRATALDGLTRLTPALQ